MQGENRVRLYFRALLLAMPGVSDHFPCEYERALRKEVAPPIEGTAAARMRRAPNLHEE
jgi:hypothetical protein